MIRYFLVFSFGVFFAYWKGLLGKWALLLIGPILYLASFMKNLLGTYVKLETGSPASLFGIVLPITLLYFGIASFLIKKLWAERGLIKVISLLGIIGFLGYIHYFSWVNLQGYFRPAY